MNKILSEMPILTDGTYAPIMPLWLVNGLRIFSVLFSLYVAWLGYLDWSKMPIFAKVTICLLAPAFLYFSLSSKKGWATYVSNPFFLADHKGVYLRHQNAFTTFLGSSNQDKKRQSQQCLFVPWCNIANIRIGSVSSSDGYSTAAVFDVKASAEEIANFFDDGLKDKMPTQENMKAVCFYHNSVPSPSKVVAHLQEMLNQYKQFPLKEKYERIG